MLMKLLYQEMLLLGSLFGNFTYTCAREFFCSFNHQLFYYYILLNVLEFRIPKG